MIDGVSLLVIDHPSLESIGVCPLLEFKQQGKFFTARYKGLYFKMQANSCRVNGSLHKFKNNGEHNVDDFTLSDLEDVISELQESIGIDIKNTIVQNLEIGINLNLEYNPLIFADSIIGMKYARGRPRETNIGKEVNFQQYSNKIYSKSEQDKQFAGENIIRIETRFNKMTKARKELFVKSRSENIYLSNLLTPSFWFQAGRYLKAMVEDFKIVDVNKLLYSDIPKEDKLVFHEWSYRYRYAVSDSEKQTLDRKLNRLISKYSMSNVHKDFKKLVDEKISILLSHPHIKSYVDSLDKIRNDIL